jgi:hypothetical protein
MQLSDNNRNALLLSLHKLIEEYADTQAKSIFQGEKSSVSYPPNGGLSEAEEQALKQLQGNELLMTALRKLFASNSAGVFFSFFSVIDGVAEPDVDDGNWSEVLLIDKPEDFEDDVQFLHDEFLSTYWDWRDIRDDKGWTLDTLE